MHDAWYTLAVAVMGRAFNRPVCGGCCVCAAERSILPRQIVRHFAPRSPRRVHGYSQYLVCCALYAAVGCLFAFFSTLV